MSKKGGRRGRFALRLLRTTHGVCRGFCGIGRVRSRDRNEIFRSVFEPWKRRDMRGRGKHACLARGSGSSRGVRVKSVTHWGYRGKRESLQVRVSTMRREESEALQVKQLERFAFPPRVLLHHHPGLPFSRLFPCSTVLDFDSFAQENARSDVAHFSAPLDPVGRQSTTVYHNDGQSTVITRVAQ